jgi:ABC-2 type transport system permease protein
MHKLIALIRNEFAREFDSPTSWVFFLLLPLVFTAAVGAGLGGLGGGAPAEPEVFSSSIAVLNEDAGDLGQLLVDALPAHDLYPQMAAEWPEQGMALRVPPDFTQRLLAGEPVTLSARIPPTTSSTAIEQMLRAAVGKLNSALAAAQAALAQAREAGLIAPEREAAFLRQVLADTLAAAASPPVATELRWSGGVDLGEATLAGATGAQQASAGQLVTWVQITLLGAAEVLVAERLMGTWKRLLITPTRRNTLLAGKLFARLFLGLVQMTLLIGGGMLLFRVNWGDNLPAVALVSLAFATATVSLGMLLATVVRTRSQANSVVIGLSMGMAAMGGAWFPLEITPALYRQAVQVLPSTWAMRAYTNLLARNADVQGVLLEVGVLFGFAVLFTAIGALRLGRTE